ncbi:MAG: Uncharacterized protein G01um101425_512 [Candidatus Peregrinibacteria bacterium Gr01-1014_25]|nr:MAG: Uncharacterized protein G01um101425_512 [Candidatus Peregrinibacteria bacterium Gr01-1014_25]
MLNRLLFRRHVEEDEEMVRIIHKHWLLGLKALLWPTVILTLCIVLLALQPARPLFIILSLMTIWCMVWWLRCFFDYYLDAWIITSSGIIDVAWHGWFHRESTRVLYSDIQGVSYEISGVWGTLLRFGMVSVEKISTGTAISLESVRNPRRVEATILKCMETYVHAKNLKNAKHVQELLADLVAGKMQEEEMEDPA